MDEDADEALIESGLDPKDFRGTTFYEGAGCLECNGTGFHGRAAISELLDLSDRIRTMILDRRPASEIKRAAHEEGMTFLRESGDLDGEHHPGQLSPGRALAERDAGRGAVDQGGLCAGQPLGENRNGSEMVSGRDHHPFAFSLWMAGGGIKGGQTWGETDEIGWGISRDPVHVNDYHATILHAMGIDHKQLTYRYAGRDFRLTDVHGNVVKEVLA